MNRAGILRCIMLGGLAVATFSCGPMQVTQKENYSFDGVKLIAAGVQDPNDPSSWTQEKYSVGPTRRLLLRYESLESHVQSATIDEKNPIEVEVTVTTADQLDKAKAALSLCPVVRKWNNNATWAAGYPYDSTGRWGAAGGDYDSGGCVKSSRVDGQSLIFDMTQWFINYPRGRGKNYGLILLADQALEIYGDSSGSYSPRILWNEQYTINPNGN